MNSPTNAGRAPVDAVVSVEIACVESVIERFRWPAKVTDAFVMAQRIVHASGV